MRSERMFLPLLIVQNKCFVDESRASGDDDQLPSLTMMYFHDGAPPGPRRRPKEEANLRNGDCSSHRFDGLGWRDCEKNLLVVDQTVEELQGSWNRYGRIRCSEVPQKSWIEPMLDDHIVAFDGDISTIVNELVAAGARTFFFFDALAKRYSK